MKNRFGVDVTYFRRWFDRSLQNLADYKPDELARELARMSRTADSKVVQEREFSDDGAKVAYELLADIGEKAGIEEGDVAAFIEWIDKLPDPGKEKPTVERLALECRASALRRKADGNMWTMMLDRAEWLEDQDERMSKGGDTIPKSD